MNKINKDWQEVKLGDIGNIITGSTPPTKNKEYFGKDCLFITPTDYRNCNKYISNSERGISILGIEKLKNRLLPSGSIMVTCIATMGKVLINKLPAITNQQINSIIIDNKKFSADFIYYLLIHNNNKIKSIVSGSAVPILNKKDFSNLVFEFPPLAEQKRIASILSALDDKIELNNKTNKILEEMAQTIFKEWFINFNFPNEDGKPYKKSGGEMIDSELGKIPKGWKVGTIGDYAKLKSGFAFKNSWWQNDGIPVIKIQNISSGNLNLEQCSFVSEDKYNIAENFRVNGGDLLITLTGSLCKFTIVPKLDKDALVNQRVGKFFLGEEPVKKLPFLYGILNELKDLIVSLANGSVQQNISPTDVENVKIIFPNDKILNKYNNLMQDIFYKIIFNQRENKKLSNIRDSLLPKLMTPNGRRADGEIRV